jgi:chitin disaccharide deacetylase
VRRRLIFNADDYGLTAGVCAGIRQAAQGVVRSTTVLTNVCAPEDARALAGSGLSAGLHLNLSYGPPLIDTFPPELLLPNGNFDKRRALDARTWQKTQYQLAARREWQAQFECAGELGLTPDHLDSHHHVHLLPALFPLALALAQEHRLSLRVRQEQVAQARSAGVLTPDALIEGYYGQGNIDRGHLLELLGPVAGGVVEVMCHPGQADQELTQVSGYTAERAEELACLRDAQLAEMLEDAGWQISGYCWG